MAAVGEACYHARVPLSSEPLHMQRSAFFAVFACILAVGNLQAQSVLKADSARPPEHSWPRGWTLISSTGDERLRFLQLGGESDDRGAYLLRSPSSLLPRREGSYAALLAPRIGGTWNARIPHSLNDGAAWSGKGITTRVVTGLELVAGPLRLIAAPEFVMQENAAFDSLLPGKWDAEQRARFTAPWSVGRNSIDLPYRFGDDGNAKLYAGESSLILSAGGLEAGIATESQWWGPGIRNAILLSDNAGGFPHAVIRTSAPLRTPLGFVNGRFIAGRLSSSAFDTVPGGDRSLSGAILSVSPSRGLSLGASRVVYSAGRDAEIGDALAVFTRWLGAGDTTLSRPYDQMLSVFGRWVLPSDGAEIYAEWAHRRIGSIRGLLETPEHSQGYILGGQWRRPVGRDAIRLQGELTYLEKSATYRATPVGTWYAGRAVPQGYTHRGQVLGAAIGPGASSQWFAADYVSAGWQLGLYANRIRWANDAYYEQPGGPNRYRAHDVSILGGARASVCAGVFWITAEYTAGRRYNFLFQDSARDFNERYLSVSPFNHTVQLSLSPRVR
jgi:hypothetical protein